jgi:hypothetical protein
MNTAQLIAILLPVLTQVTPQLVKDVVDLIHGNPQQQGETDDLYVSRIGGLIDQNTAKVVAEDQEIQS